jgi:hypothetical protein
VPFTGVTVKPTPSHVTVVIAVISAAGLIVTVTVNAAPVQPPGDNGVTIYVAVLAVFAVLLNVPKMLEDAVTCACKPVTLVPVGVPHVYVVPAGTTPFVLSVGVTLNDTPLHVVAVIAVTTAFGSTVTSTVNVAPTHDVPFVVGVTVYVAVCCVLVGFDKVPNTFVCNEPDAPPVIPPVTPGILQL